MKPVANTGTRRCLPLDDSGSTAIEIAVLIPIAMFLVLLVAQMCIWAHAATLVQYAADRGSVVATEAEGSPTAGVEEAKRFLFAEAGEIVQHSSVEVADMPGDVLRLSVTGTAESIIPWFRFPVSAVRIGPVQEFRESG